VFNMFCYEHVFNMFYNEHVFSSEHVLQLPTMEVTRVI